MTRDGEHEHCSDEMSVEELGAVAGGGGIPGVTESVVPSNSTVPIGAVVTPYPNGWVPAGERGTVNIPTGLPPMVPDGGGQY